MKKFFVITILFFLSFSLGNITKADYSQPVYSDECKNAEQVDFAHFFCWIGEQLFNTATPPPNLPPSGIFNTLTLKLHSRLVNSGTSTFGVGSIFWLKNTVPNPHYCYLPSFTIPNDGQWHDVTFVIANSIADYNYSIGSPDCVLDFSKERLVYIHLNNFAFDTAWTDHSVYSDSANTQAFADFGIPGDRSLYFIINNGNFQFTSPTANQVITKSALNITGTCPVNGTNELAIMAQMSDPVFQPNYNVDCVSGAFSTNLTLQSSDSMVYAIDQSSGSIISLPIKVNFLQPTKVPVLIVPGTLGTEIWKGNEKLWLDINRLVLTANDNFMDDLAFKENGVPLNTNLILGDVLQKPVDQFDYSKQLIADLSSQGYQADKDLFLFPYDWRDDIIKNADIFLKQEIDNVLASTTASSLDIVAHSQGGLLIKWLLYNHPEYQSKVNKLILVGTPNLGSPKSFKALVEGDDLGIKKFKIFGLDPDEIKKISHNMPSIYEMLPSQEYFKHYNGYWGQVQKHFFSPDTDVIYDYTTTKQNLKDGGYNDTLLDHNDSFHVSAFDNFDFTGTGVKAYNIVGCQTPTYGGVIEKSFGKDKIIWVPGDETVPLKSATNVGGAETFYSWKTSHGTMLTQDGIRQKIVNLITGSSLPENYLTSMPELCRLDGEEVAVHSPVDLNVYDQLGRHVGPTAEGGFDWEIPNAGYETIGQEKFAFLPEGNTYTVKLKATGSGEFTFDSSIVVAGQTVNMAYYDSITISTSSAATINLNTVNDQSIELDKNGDGQIDSTISPSAILDRNQSQDLLPPISTSTISGLAGQAGFYRSDVSISFSATDPAVPGHESEASGVLNTQYNLDNAGFVTYSTTTPISVSQEGKHTLEFFSTDRAGNNEDSQTINFTIDKTAPEFNVQFSPILNDLQFTGTDNISSSTDITVLDKDDIVTLTDSAGNTAQITLKNKDRKKSMSAEIKSLSYGNLPADIGKNLFHFDWNFDKNGILKQLVQNVKSKQNFKVLALYNDKTTKLAGNDAGGKIFNVVNGLVILQVFTDKGNLGWKSIQQ